MSTSIVAQPDKSLCAVPAGRPGEYLAPRPAVPLRGSGHLPPTRYSAAADAPAGTSLPGASGAEASRAGARCFGDRSTNLTGLTQSQHQKLRASRRRCSQQAPSATEVRSSYLTLPPARERQPPRKQAEAAEALPRGPPVSGALEFWRGPAR